MNEKLIEKLKEIVENHIIILNTIKNSDELLKSVLDELEIPQQIFNVADEKVTDEDIVDVELENVVDNIFDNIDYEHWPLAIVESAIVKNEKDKWVRSNLLACGYVDAKTPILDYGCGEGHLTVVLNNMDKLTYGYDIKEYECWSNFKSSHGRPSASNKFLDLETISDMKFKSIIMHDVADHVVGCSAKELVDKAYDLLDDDGKLYLSVHPFSGINGGHLYEEDNRAFLHLLLDDDKLNKFKKYLPNIKVIRPQAQYNQIIGDRFEIEHKELITNKLDQWVIDNIFDNICDRWYKTIPKDQVKKILEIIKINYVLSKS